MNRVINEAGSPYSFSHVKIYASWETDIIIGAELWRNLGLSITGKLSLSCHTSCHLGLSITAVVLVTFLLLCDVRICLMVVLMVTIR